MTAPTVVVNARAAARWRNGHPWIYRSDVQPARHAPGIVRVEDGRRRFLGQALWSPRSEIRLRLLTRSGDPVDQAWWTARIREANERRDTSRSAYRVVHGEGDGLPSLIIDRYGEYVVAQLLSAGADGLVRSWAILGDGPTGEDIRADGAPLAALSGSTDPGARLFAKCAACHTLTPEGGNKAGPTLYGLFGRRAGTVADYPYSPALRNSAIVWTEQTVDRLFALGPQEVTPGSKMPLQRMPDASERAALIAFLQRTTRTQGDGEGQAQ